ncbi:ead/Ea22-like family protein [Escherichia coli]|nr:ead/Ea22-like family protein [Escherichia coli]
MSNIDKRALRHSAESIIGILENIAGFEPSDIDGDSVELRFETDDGLDTGCDVSIVDQCQKTADVVRALLDELERNQQYIKSRDQEDEDIALTAGKLLIENGRLVADTLRHLADNEIDSDYFVITSTNENGTEIDHEMAITDYALQAAGTVDELVAALESAEKRIAELEARGISLPERSGMLHRTDFHDDYQTVMAYKVSEVIDAIRATGIRIKGE